MHKNKDHPFYIKRKVLEAACNAALLYGAESWLDCNPTEISALYLQAIKLTLGVRETTNNDICLLEINMPAVNATIKEMQYRFFKKASCSQVTRHEDPLKLALHLHQLANTKLHCSVTELLTSQKDYRDTDERVRKNIVMNSAGSKHIAYRSMNPDLTSLSLYSTPETGVPEHHRINMTRLRCISHNLAVETGRWSRVPREQRLCLCGAVQTELYVLFSCPLLNTERHRHFGITPEVQHLWQHPSTPAFITDLITFFSR